LLKENKSTRSSIKNFHLLFVNDVVVIRTITFYTTNTHIVYAIYVNGGKIGVSISARREEKREMEEKREREKEKTITLLPPLLLRSAITLFTFPFSVQRRKDV